MIDGDSTSNRITITVNPPEGHPSTPVLSHMLAACSDNVSATVNFHSPSEKQGLQERWPAKYSLIIAEPLFRVHDTGRSWNSKVQFDGFQR